MREEQVSLRNQLVRNVDSHDDKDILPAIAVESAGLRYPLAEHPVPVRSAGDAYDFSNHDWHGRCLVNCCVAKVALRLVPMHDTVGLDKYVERPRLPSERVVSIPT